MDAEEARKLTDEVLDQQNREIAVKQIAQVKERIKEKIKEGKYSVNLSYFLKSDARRYFEDKGYKVQEHEGYYDDYHSVQW